MRDEFIIMFLLTASLFVLGIGAFRPEVLVGKKIREVGRNLGSEYRRSAQKTFLIMFRILFIVNIVALFRIIAGG